MNYEVELRKRIHHFESNIREQTDFDTPAEKLIQESMFYSLNAGGKRLRPILMLEVASRYSVPFEEVLPFALALEMIHTYSLIHDDLPCMDNDDIRRGKPTNHVVFGEDIATLAGDGLLNLASETMVDAVVDFGYKPAMIRAMQEILKASGASGMILGQVADITYDGNHMTIEKLDYINSLKTGKLITAALVSGGLLGNADKKHLKVLEQVGQKMGLMFQMVDDILDLNGDPEKMGKKIQMDLQNDKRTYPMIMGIEKTEQKIEQLKKSILDGLASIEMNTEFMVETVHFLSNRDY